MGKSKNIQETEISFEDQLQQLEILKKIANRKIITEIVPKTADLLISTPEQAKMLPRVGRKFTLISMSGTALHNWTAMQGMRIWRMIEKARSFNETVTLTGMDSLTDAERDERLFELSKDLLDTSNMMTFEALGMCEDEEDPQFLADCDFIQALTWDQKEEILTNQDTLNVQAILSAVLALDRESNKREFADLKNLRENLDLIRYSPEQE